MQILALQTPVIAMDIVLGTVIIAADRQRQWAIVGLVAAIFNPLLNVVAIPMTTSLFDNGAIGAATVTVVAEVILMVGAFILRPAGVLDRATTRLLLRIVGASAAMVPVVLALGSQPLGVKILAGILTYGIVSLVLRTISVRDVRTLTFGEVGRDQSSVAA